MEPEKVHQKVREKAQEGMAYKWGYSDTNPGYVYYDDETEQWLCAFHDKGYNLFPDESFPTGYEIGMAWDDHEWVDVEETPLYHGTYGLDQARDGYGPVVGR